MLQCKEINKNQELCKKFLEVSMHERLNFLALYSDNTKITKLMNGLEYILPKVKEEIFLHCFELGFEEFLTIISLSKNVKRLVFPFWTIGLSEQDFPDPKTGVNIKYLDFFGTISGIIGLKWLVSILKKTDIENSLEKIHIQNDPKTKDILIEELSNEGFVKTKVVCDSLLPVPKSVVLEVYP